MESAFIFVGWCVLVLISLSVSFMTYACTLFSSNGDWEPRVLMIVAAALWFAVFKFSPFGWVAQ